MMSGRDPGSPRVPRQPAVRHPPLLTINALGGVGLSFAGQEVQLRNRKARALIAYLALSEAKCDQRERLAGLLWSDTSEKKARNSLRHVVFDLREALSSLGCAALRFSRTTIELDGSAIELDIDIVLRDVAEGKVPDALLIHSSVVDTLLAGYEDLSPLFREWIMVKRRAVQKKLLRALQRGYEVEVASRDQQVRMAQAAFLLDPLNEAACRTVMRLAAEDGETGAALRAYDDLYHALGEEMDMEPSAPTRELVARIKQGHCDPRSSLDPSNPTAGLEASVQRAKPAIGVGVPTLTVLPFRTIGPDPVPEYFAESVVEDTVCKLAKLRELLVISGNPPGSPRGSKVDLGRVGPRLDAQYIVSGAVRRSANQLRLSVKLADVTNGSLLWANTYDTAEPHLLATQNDIAASIVQALVPMVRAAELRCSRAQDTGELTVYHLMLQARDLAFRLEQEAFEQAGRLLHRATAMDPSYAPTHVALADWYSVRLGQGWSPDPESDRQSFETMARLAIGLDNASGRALAMLGHNRTILSRGYDEALALFERALDSSPNDAETVMWSSPTFAYLGDAKEAISRANRAIELSRQDPFMFRYEHFLCIGHYAAGDYEAAAHWGRCSQQRNPHYTSNLRMTTAALAGLGRAEEARPLVDKIMELQPHFHVEPLIDRQPFRDDGKRKLYGQHLVQAGLPL